MMMTMMCAQHYAEPCPVHVSCVPPALPPRGPRNIHMVATALRRICGGERIEAIGGPWSCWCMAGWVADEVEGRCSCWWQVEVLWEADVADWGTRLGVGLVYHTGVFNLCTRSIWLGAPGSRGVSVGYTHE